jgi:hypothetical protein
MTTTTTAPKVFISYSWKPATNKQKALSLAERLTGDGIHVIIDEWDLQEGQDKYKFMEQMVNNPEIIRVLIICNKDYAEKANHKKGGVGVESLIISDEVYQKAEQKKFVPIIFERDGTSGAYVPTFVSSRIYIDLSADDIFEGEYEKLIRNIFEKPASKRPPIGAMPSYIEIEEPIFLSTAHKVSTIKYALINEKKNVPLFIQDYLDTFVSSMKNFSLNEDQLTGENYIEEIQKKIDNFIVLRNDFIDFLDTYSSYSVNIDTEKLHRFFEKLIEYAEINEYTSYQTNTLGYLKADPVRFFYYELFLTFTAFLLEKERFSELAYILQTPFITHDRRTDSIGEKTFACFRQHVSTLSEHKNKKFNLHRVSITADTIKQRATERIKFEKIVEADILLYYISLFFPDSNRSYHSTWFPETSCYSVVKLSTIAKTVSQRYFDRIKILFGVNSKEELIEKTDFIVNNNLDNVQRGYFNFPNIKWGLRIDELCKLK